MASKFSVFTEFKIKDKVTPTFKKMTKSAKSFGVKVGNAAMFAGGKFKKFFKTITSFKSLLAGLGIGIAIKKMVDYIDKTGKLGDTLAKTARAIDIEASSLQKLQFVAQRQGVSVVTLNKGLEKLNRNVGELKLGTGTLNTMLKRANPAMIEQLRNVKSTEEAFDLMIDAIDKAPDTFQKTVLSVAAFGRTGVELLRVTKGGADNILKLKKRFKELGGVISDDALKLTEEYMDATLDMSIATRGLRFAIAEQLFPDLTKMVKKFAEWIASNRELIASGVEATVKKIGEHAVKIKEGFDGIDPQFWKDLNFTLRTTVTLVDLLGKGLRVVSVTMKDISKASAFGRVGQVGQVAGAKAAENRGAVSFVKSIATILGVANQRQLALAGTQLNQAAIDVTVKADQGTTATVKSSGNSGNIRLKDKSAGIQ